MDFPKSTPSAGLVNGRFVDEDLVTGSPGSLILASWANQVTDELLAVIKDAGLDPKENDSAQLLQAIKKIALPIFDVVPKQKTSEVIYVLSRQSIMQWVTIGSWSGYASPRVGSVEYGWTPAPLPWQIDAMGGVFKKADYPALYARFQASGLLVSSAAWKAKEFKICDVSSTDFRAPDLRDQFLRFTGTDADTANARVMATYQLDALQRLKGELHSRSGDDPGPTTPGGLYGGNGVFSFSARSGAHSAGVVHNMPSTEHPFRLLDMATFDSSRVTRSSNETRPSNTTFVPRLYV